MKPVIVASFIMLFALSGNALAFIEDHDEYSLELKGFSPEMIQPVEIQINRMEGRYPEAAPSKGKQALYNFLNNTWMESLEPFSQDEVTAPHWPRLP